MSETRRVLVLDGETRTALACVRSLSARGHRVEVCAHAAPSLAGSSRHSRLEHRVPDPGERPLEFAAAIEALAASDPQTVILAVTEVSLGSLYAAGLPDRQKVLCPAREAYEQAVDKHALLERAARLGIAVPRGQLLEEPAAHSLPPDGFDFPLIVKARRSRWLEDGRWHMGGVHVVHDLDGWRAAVNDPGMSAGALVQAFVEGHGEAVFLLTGGGESGAKSGTESKVYFAHERLREKPPTGGVSTLRRAIEPDPNLLTASAALLADLEFDGVAMVEYRRPPSGPAVLMEINPRLWGSLQLAIDAGVDFPALMLDQSLGQAFETPTLRAGVRTRWLLGDFDHLLIGLRRSRVRSMIGKTMPALILGFLRSFFDGTKTEVWRADDPQPFLRELRGWWRS